MAIGGVSELAGHGTTITFAFGEWLGKPSTVHCEERLDILILHSNHILVLIRELQSLIKSVAGRPKSDLLLLFKFSA